MPRAKVKAKYFDPRIREILVRAATEEVVFTRGTPPVGLDTDELLEWNDTQRRKLNVLAHRISSFKKQAELEQIDGWEEFQKISVRMEPNTMRTQRIVVGLRDLNIKDILDQIPDLEPKLPDDPEFWENLVTLSDQPKEEPK